jgi:hypothetical protein
MPQQCSNQQRLASFCVTSCAADELKKGELGDDDIDSVMTMCDGDEVQSSAGSSRQTSPWPLIEEISDPRQVESSSFNSFSSKSSDQDTDDISEPPVYQGERDLCEAPWGKLPEAAFRKTRMCKFHEQGFCRKGSDCAFSHDQSRLHSRPDLFRTRLCLAFERNGKCKDGSTCKYAHGVEQLRSSVAIGKQDALCNPLSSNPNEVRMSSGIITLPLASLLSPDALASLRAADALEKSLDAYHWITNEGWWMKHSASGLEFCVKNTFLSFNLPRVGSRRRSASLER